jgi:peptidoglycan/xylan/chitin deacetylase (PgdA/CDA1 family)
VKELRKRLIVTTSWDDNSYENAALAKLLDKYGVRGTFYICSNKDKNRNNLKQKRIRDMVMEIAKSNHEIGSQTVNHEDLTKCKEPEREVRNSKFELERLTGTKVISFAYPFGAYRKRNDRTFQGKIENLIEKTGYECARSCEYVGTTGPGNPYEFGISVAAVNRWSLKQIRGEVLDVARSKYNSRIGLVWVFIYLGTFFDWELRAKLLFCLATKTGEVWHLMGHPWEIGAHGEWKKLARVLKYISRKKGVYYLTNGEAIRRLSTGTHTPH